MERVFIHETAEVSKQATIGANTKVWNQVQIRENAIIGENCILSKNVYIDAGVHVGSGVKIQNNVSVYRGVEIDDDVFVGPSVTFTNDRYPRAFNGDFEVSPTFIKKGASLCANSTIRCGITVGEYAMVAAGSIVTHDVEPYTLVMGNPARAVGKVCKCGRVLDENNRCPVCDSQ